MTAAPIDEVVDLLRTLRLPHMRAAAPELLATAKAQRWEPAEAMRALLAEELSGRQASSVRSRRKAAGFPTGKTFDVWDESVSSIPEPTQRALRTLEWVERAENLVVCGPSGTGKTHCETTSAGPTRTRTRVAPVMTRDSKTHCSRWSGWPCFGYVRGVTGTGPDSAQLA